MTSRDTTWAKWNTDWWDKQGVRGGLVGGGGFLLVYATIGEPDPRGSAVLGPLRLAASLLHGQDALDPDASLGPVVVTGMLVHLVLSALFGLGFAVLIGSSRALRRSGPLMVSVGLLYGACLWLVNLYGVAPTYGWTWIPEVADPTVWAITHVVGYGASLALYIAHAAVPRRRLGLD